MTWAVWVVGFLLVSANAFAQTVPEAPGKRITNGIIRAKVDFPDPSKGFYRGTRFDWSGVIESLEFKGHNYYGPWFTRTDPKVRDFVYDGPDIVAGPCSAITGPVEEFSTNGSALGFEDAKPGGTFVKIGVGVLRRPDDAKYSAYRLYEIVDHGEWGVEAKPDSVTFTHRLRDSTSGYGYIYRKTVRLVEDKPELRLEHSLQNVGTKPIESRVYDHNFLVLDKQPPGPDFAITLPFALSADGPLKDDLAKVSGNQIRFKQVLRNEDRVYTAIRGFTNSPDDYKVQIENSKVKAGIRLQGNRPIEHEALWSIRSVISVEPFIGISVQPGTEFRWEYTYYFYTIP